MDKKVILVVFLLFLLPLFSAQPPFEQTAGLDRSIQIEAPVIEYIPQSEDFKFHIHTHNISDGLLLNNETVTYCAIHLYDNDGNHLIEDNMSFDSNGVDWEYLVLGGNFSRIGQYAVLYYCEVTDEQGAGIGGFIEYAFYVTYSGHVASTAQGILYAALISVFIFLFILIIHFKKQLPEEGAKDDNGNFVEYNWLKYLRSVLLFFEWMLTIAIFYITSNVAFAYLQTELIAKVLFALYQICMALTPVIVILWFIWIFVSIFQDKKRKRLIEKGIFNLGEKL